MLLNWVAFVSAVPGCPQGERVFVLLKVLKCDPDRSEGRRIAQHTNHDSGPTVESGRGKERKSGEGECLSSGILPLKKSGRERRRRAQRCRSGLLFIFTLDCQIKRWPVCFGATCPVSHRSELTDKEVIISLIRPWQLGMRLLHEARSLDVHCRL